MASFTTMMHWRECFHCFYSENQNVVLVFAVMCVPVAYTLFCGTGLGKELYAQQEILSSFEEIPLTALK